MLQHFNFPKIIIKILIMIELKITGDTHYQIQWGVYVYVISA